MNLSSLESSTQIASRLCVHSNASASAFRVAEVEEQPPNRSQTPCEYQRVEGRDHVRYGLPGRVGYGVHRAYGNRAATILPDHGQGAAHQIAEAVGQLRIVAANQRVVAEAAVLPEDDLAQQEIAQRVRPDHLPDRLRAHD